VTTELLLRVFPEVLCAHHGKSLLVTDRAGAIGGGLQGLYDHDLRLLSRHRLLLHGKPPRLDQLSAVDHYSTLAYYVAPPRRGGGEEADRELVLRVARFVGQGLHEDVAVTNHGLDEVRLEIAWELAADFADLNEARRGKRQQEAPVAADWRVGEGGEAELRFDYLHPRLPRGSLVRLRRHGTAAGPGPTWDGKRLAHRIVLGAQETDRFCLTVVAVVDGEVREPTFGCGAFGLGTTARAEVTPAWALDATRIETPNAAVRASWDRAAADLASLALGEGSTPVERATPAAGIPNYAALFGRDALTAAGQGLLLSPALAEGTLRFLARHLGAKEDDFYDEQPGRVPQQLRDGPLGLLGLTPWRHDYGDYAAPCAFLVLLGGHHLVAGDLQLVRDLLEPAKRVLGWLEERADLDGDGFLEYRTRSPKGQRHQGWKDSGNAVVDDRGRQVEPPIAACEIQGYWYAARLLMAEIFLSVGESARAFGLFRQAVELKRRFQERFWMPEERFVAFGLDGDKKQIRSIASNAGHCLATGVVAKEHAEDVVRRLMAPDMFSGWGIRTLSSQNPAYNPFSYHLGSVWPPENATTAFGMMRYGFAAECSALCKALFDAAALFEHHRLPEALGGHPRDADHPHPGVYPDSCAPQAWSASAVVWLVHSMLGLWSYAPLSLLVVKPELPDWLPELTLRGLRIGQARATIEFRRDAGGTTDFRVLEREGTLHVVRQPPPEDVHAGPFERLADLAHSLLPGH
jgi:glycogen debranching enzyme